MIRKLLAIAGTTLVLAACTPTGVPDDDPRFDCRTMGNLQCGSAGTWTVTRHEGQTHIVTPDGVLIIVPIDGSCVRLAIGEIDDAPCLPEGQ